MKTGLGLRRLKYLLLGSVATLLSATPADAMFLAPIIGALGTAVAGLFTWTTVASFAISVGLSYGLSLLSSKKTTPDTKQDRGIQSQVQMGGDIVRSCIFGRYATAGHLVYANTWGSNNDLLEQAFCLGDSIHEGIEGFVIDAKPYAPGAAGDFGTIITGWTRTPSGGRGGNYAGGDPAMWYMYHGGTHDQVANSLLVAHGSTLAPNRWTATSTLSGIAYV